MTAQALSFAVLDSLISPDERRSARLAAHPLVKDAKVVFLGIALRATDDLLVGVEQLLTGAPTLSGHDLRSCFASSVMLSRRPKLVAAAAARYCLKNAIQGPPQSPTACVLKQQSATSRQRLILSILPPPRSARWSDVAAAAAEQPSCSLFLGVPLVAADGAPFGALLLGVAGTRTGGALRLGLQLAAELGQTHYVALLHGYAEAGAEELLRPLTPSRPQLGPSGEEEEEGEGEEEVAHDTWGKLCVGGGFLAPWRCMWGTCPPLPDDTLSARLV